MAIEPKRIRDAAFGKRLTDSCDANPNVPPPNFGRLNWIRDELEKRYHDSMSVESVRKWLAGEVKPKPERIQLLARLLDLDPAWLAMGIAPEMTQRDRRLMSSESNGAVLVVAGLIKMANGVPSFPEEDDKRAIDYGIDLYAIIRGATYSMHVAVAHDDDGLFKFAVPANHDSVMQIGVIPISDFAIRMIELPIDAIENGRRRGASIEVVLTADEVAKAEIKSLRERL